jgi:hypothetical protein
MTMNEALKIQIEIPRPRYRFKLKGAIHTAGYRTVKEFSLALGFSAQLTNRILCGWIYPSPEWQRRAMKLLGLGMRDFRELL